MTRLEELEILIKNKQDIYDEKCKIADAAIAEQVKIVTSIIKNLFTGFIHGGGDLNDRDRVGVTVSISNYSSLSSWTGKVYVLNDKGKEEFGTDIAIYFERKWYSTGKPRVSLNTGTCGTFAKEDEDQILKYKLMAILVDNFDLLTDTLVKASNALENVLKDENNAEKELNKLTDEKKEILRKEEEAKIIAQILPGTYYTNHQYRSWRSNNFFKNYPTARVESMTEKSVNLKVGYILSQPGTGKTFFEVNESYRMKKDEFVRYAKAKVFEIIPAPEIND